MIDLKNEISILNNTFLGFPFHSIPTDIISSSPSIKKENSRNGWIASFGNAHIRKKGGFWYLTMGKDQALSMGDEIFANNGKVNEFFWRDIGGKVMSGGMFSKLYDFKQASKLGISSLRVKVVYARDGIQSVVLMFPK